MGNSGEREALATYRPAASTNGAAPVGEVQASLLAISAGSRSACSSTLAPASALVEQGSKRWQGCSAACEQAELVAPLKRSGLPGKAAAGDPATHYLVGAGVERIDRRQQAGQARGSRVEISAVGDQAAQGDQ